MLPVVLLLAVCLLCAIKVYRTFTYYRLRRKHGCEEPPKYPHIDPFFGIDYWRSQKKAAERSQWLPTSKSLFAKYGKTYEINNLGQRMIHTMEVQNIQSVWASNFQDWGLQPLREGIAEPFFNHGINTTDGEFWRHSRALVRPTFARTSIANLSFLGRHVDRLIEQLPPDSSTVNLQPLFSRLVSLDERPGPGVLFSLLTPSSRYLMHRLSSSLESLWIPYCLINAKSAKPLLKHSTTVYTL